MHFCEFLHTSLHCGSFEGGQTAQAIQAINEKQGIGRMAPSNMKLEKETRVQQDEIILLIICLYTSIAIWYT